MKRRQFLQKAAAFFGTAAAVGVGCASSPAQAKAKEPFPGETLKSTLPGSSTPTMVLDDDLSGGYLVPRMYIDDLDKLVKFDTVLVKTGGKRCM